MVTWRGRSCVRRRKREGSPRGGRWSGAGLRACRVSVYHGHLLCWNASRAEKGYPCAKSPRKGDRSIDSLRSTSEPAREETSAACPAPCIDARACSSPHFPSRRNYIKERGQSSFGATAELVDRQFKRREGHLKTQHSRSPSISHFKNRIPAKVGRPPRRHDSALGLAFKQNRLTPRSSRVGKGADGSSGLVGESYEHLVEPCAWRVSQSAPSEGGRANGTHRHGRRWS